MTCAAETLEAPVKLEVFRIFSSNLGPDRWDPMPSMGSGTSLGSLADGWGSDIASGPTQNITTHSAKKSIAKKINSLPERGFLGQ